jgi:dTDP-4-amino-4,6-dideoxygalactose transaminase
VTGLAEALTERYEGVSCRLFARGSTGLYALFRALEQERGPGDVLIPEICCESVALAALYAGLTPRLVDCDRDTLCLSLESVERSLSPATRAVVVVYIFGNLVDPMPFARLREGHGFVLVEDLAQAVGGRLAGGEVGRRGDFTLLSFAPDKIVSGEGGALVQRTALDIDPAYEAAAGSLPAAPSDRVLRQKALSLRNLCHSLYDLSRADATAPLAATFAGLAPRYRDLIVRAGSPSAPDAIQERLQRLDEERAARRARFVRYRDGIRSPHVSVVEFAAGAMCWRACLLAEEPEDAFAITDALRGHGIPASNHYFPLGRLLFDRAQPSAAHLGARLINLWVDESATEERIARTLDLINSYARGEHSRRPAWTR